MKTTEELLQESQEFQDDCVLFDKKCEFCRELRDKLKEARKLISELSDKLRGEK